MMVKAVYGSKSAGRADRNGTPEVIVDDDVDSNDSSQASDDADAGYNAIDDCDNNNVYAHYPPMNDGAPIEGVYPIAGVHAADNAGADGDEGLDDENDNENGNENANETENTSANEEDGNSTTDKANNGNQAEQE